MKIRTQDTKIALLKTPVKQAVYHCEKINKKIRWLQATVNSISKEDRQMLNLNLQYSIKCQSQILRNSVDKERKTKQDINWKKITNGHKNHHKNQVNKNERFTKIWKDYFPSVKTQSNELNIKCVNNTKLIE